jgi:hypothetical protein
MSSLENEKPSTFDSAAGKQESSMLLDDVARSAFTSTISTGPGAIHASKIISSLNLLHKKRRSRQAATTEKTFVGNKKRPRSHLPNPALTTHPANVENLQVRNCHNGDNHPQDSIPNSDEANTRQTKIPQRLASSNDDDDDSVDDSNRRLPLGYFSGRTILRNRVQAQESLEDGHVSLSNLILPGCTSALVTTFESPDPKWVDSVLGDIAKLIVIRPDPEKLRNVGDARMDPLLRSKRPEWFFVSCQPHTNGCLHGKVLLFRSHEGLRVVISGNNFYQYQFENERDLLWAQDFFAVRHHKKDRNPPPGANPEFSNRLVSFLTDMSRCRESAHQQLVQERLDALFGGIDLSVAHARLVYSFPRTRNSNESCGGWRQLAGAFRDLLKDYDTDDSTTIQTNKARRSNQQEESYPLYAMSGSIGDVQPDFLQQMQWAMQGDETTNASKNIKWENIKGIRCLMPSQETARTINPVWNGRPMKFSHWQKIPEQAKRRIFFNAVPNPSETALPYHPFSHGKALYTGSVVGARQKTAVVYVGSHNFSRAAWGVRGEMPRNVEIGVVLSTTNQATSREWQERLPYCLPTASLSPSTYVPATTEMIEKRKESRSQG